MEVHCTGQQKLLRQIQASRSTTHRNLHLGSLLLNPSGPTESEYPTFASITCSEEVDSPALEYRSMLFLRSVADDPACEVAHLMRERVPNAFCRLKQQINTFPRISEDCLYHRNQAPSPRVVSMSHALRSGPCTCLNSQRKPRYKLFPDAAEFPPTSSSAPSPRSLATACSTPAPSSPVCRLQTLPR